VPAEAIVIGAGAEALLRPVLSSIQAQRALVPTPAFSEYRRVCTQQQIQLVPFPLDRSECFRVPIHRLCAAIENGGFGVVILNNPHNPSGSLLEAVDIRRVLAATAAARATLVLDEAFIDYAPHATLVREAAVNTHLIVLRSLTKFYGCAALRVGYAVTHPDVAPKISTLLPTWGVTQFAMDALAEAVQDHEYAQVSLRENELERERLAEALRAIGLSVFPSAANYLLVELSPGMPLASELRTRLLEQHRILIRNCDSYEGLENGKYIRVAVRDALDNVRFTQALRDVI
jgi:threonine-phosphate decarboxylase